jgi:hypothetical protein
MPKTAKAAMLYNIDSLKVIHTQIEGSEIESNPRIHLVFGYVVVALEHQDAIAKLVELKLSGSALALLRPQVETACRALWVNLISNDTDVAAIRERGASPFPEFPKMAAELDTRYNSNGWWVRYADRWGAMNGYTHTGLEQLGRRFQKDGTIAPNYSDELEAELLMMSARTSIVLVASVFRTAGREAEAEALDKWLIENS